MAEMTIHRLDPADAAAVARAYALTALAHRADTPENPLKSQQRFARGLEHPPPGSETRLYVAEADGVALGYYSLYLPTADNRQYAETELAVHPGHRRQGIGTALLDHLTAFADREERTELIVTVRTAWEGGPERSEAGVRFLERRGFAKALTEVDRRLSIGSLNPAVEQRLWEEAAAPSSAYELVSWAGRAPERHLESLARIDSLIFQEVPLGDVDLRPRTLDVERIRARDDRAEAMGMTSVRTIALHRETGDIAAHTAIYAFEDAADADQAITIVDPGHRGHRLGLAVKLANLRQLRAARPDVERIWAGNADTNAHMVAINEHLGYRVIDARLSYKRKLDG